MLTCLWACVNAALQAFGVGRGCKASRQSQRETLRRETSASVHDGLGLASLIGQEIALDVLSPIRGIGAVGAAFAAQWFVLHVDDRTAILHGGVDKVLTRGADLIESSFERRWAAFLIRLLGLFTWVNPCQRIAPLSFLPLLSSLASAPFLLFSFFLLQGQTCACDNEVVNANVDGLVQMEKLLQVFGIRCGC